MVAPIVAGAHPRRREPEPIELGVMLSRLTCAPLHVVGTFWFDTTPERSAPKDYRKALTSGVRRSLEHVLGDPDRAAGDVWIHVESGSAARVLHEMASELRAGVIVVGSTHRGMIGRIALGSTADRVLEGASCPVAVAPEGFRDAGSPPERVGVAFVDTAGGWSALACGAAFARRTGAALTAYTVIDAHTPPAHGEQAKATLERAVAEHAPGVHAEARVLRDGGLAALVAESRDLDALFRGCRAPGPVRPPLAFGVPSRLARQVACPFVIVPPGTEDRFTELLDAEAGAAHPVLRS